MWASLPTLLKKILNIFLSLLSRQYLYFRISHCFFFPHFTFRISHCFFFPHFTWEKGEGCLRSSSWFLSWQMNEAAMAALEEKLTSVSSKLESASCTIKMTDFERALTKISPSVSEKVLSTLSYSKRNIVMHYFLTILFLSFFGNSKNIFTSFCRRA